MIMLTEDDFYCMIIAVASSRNKKGKKRGSQKAENGQAVACRETEVHLRKIIK